MSATDSDPRRQALRALPAVDEVLAHPELAGALVARARALVVAATREVLAEARARILAGADAATDIVAVARAALTRAAVKDRPGTARAINATGVILHTGLGRAPLASAALAAASQAAGYCLLEIDPETGERQDRETRLAERLVRLTGAEAATVVNNNAAAVMIVLAAVARGGEVIVSRGELIEIGGSFRVPDVMSESGCKLVEVGTTNRTHLVDYERAIGAQTRALMKVWPSNYRVIGFHKEVEAGELVVLGKRAGLPVIEDLGSGLLVDLSAHGFGQEPVVAASVAAGVDLVTFSGDKLLGGPQAGIIVGSRAWVGRVRKHPLFRALRPDKLSLAALDATLALAEAPERALVEIPVLAMMTEPATAVRARAEHLAERARQRLPGSVGIAVEASQGRLGSGALPEHDVPSWSVTFALADPGGVQRTLRMGDPPIFTRVKDDRLWVDLRTVTAVADGEAILAALAAIL